MTDTLAARLVEGPSTAPSHRIGRDPISSIYLMEDHDEALRVWQRENFSNRTLLHIDAHIDFDWIPEKSFSELLDVASLQELKSLTDQEILWNFTNRREESFVHIGNYICLALREGILRTFYWVTPEPPKGVSWEKEMHRLFREFQRNHPDAFTDISVEEKRACARLYGFPLFVCTLQHLPPIEEEVLLDIDTDFLISGFLEKEEKDPYSKKPWIFPEELVTSLRSKGIRSDCVTIAYSVEGGFTPLRYKYLGDTLAQFIRKPSPNTDAYDHKKVAQAFEEEGKIGEAILEFRKALEINPRDASSLYNFSLLLLKKGKRSEAPRFYREAIASDPTYATPYNNFGILYEELGEWKKAREEYERMILLDPDNIWALCGLGNIFRSQRNFPKALFCYREALSRNPRLPDSHYGLGRISFEKHEWDEALREFQKALELKGSEAMLKFWVGATFFKKKLFYESKENLLASARLGFHSLSLHRYLFWIYFREGLTYKMRREGKKLLLLSWRRTKSQWLRFFQR